MNSPQIQETFEIWRISNKWSQGQLAKKLGVSQKTVSRIEGGAEPASDVEKKIRELGYKGLLGKSAATANQASEETGLVAAVDNIEAAMQLLASRGIKGATPSKAHELRRLVAKTLERSGPVNLANEVEEWIRAAEAIRK